MNIISQTNRRSALKFTGKYERYCNFLSVLTVKDQNMRTPWGMGSEAESLRASFNFTPLPRNIVECGSSTVPFVWIFKISGLSISHAKSMVASAYSYTS